MIDLVII